VCEREKQRPKRERRRESEREREKERESERMTGRDRDPCARLQTLRCRRLMSMLPRSCVC